MYNRAALEQNGLRGKVPMHTTRRYNYVTINFLWLGINVASGSITPLILPYMVALFVQPELKNTYLAQARVAGLAVAMLVQPLAGLLSDRNTSRWGRRRPFIAAGVALDMPFLLMMALASDYSSLLLAGVLLQFASNVAHGALQGLIPDLVPEQERGRVSGVKSIMELLPGIALIPVAKLVDRGHVAAALGIVAASLLVTTLRIGETRGRTASASFTLSQVWGSLLDTFRPPRYLWGFYVAMSVDLFAFSVGWRLINGLLTEAFSFTPGMLGLMTAVNAGTMALFQVVLGRYVDRVGYVKYLAISQALSCILLASLLINQSFPVAMAANVLMGFSAAFWAPAEQAWIAQNVDPVERAKSIGGYATFRGLVALPGPLIGGILYDEYGYHMPMLVNLVLAAIDVGLIVFLVRDRVRPEETID